MGYAGGFGELDDLVHLGDVEAGEHLLGRVEHVAGLEVFPVSSGNETGYVLAERSFSYEED